MTWIRLSIALGAVLVFLGFAVGTESFHAHDDARTYSCASVLSFATVPSSPATLTTEEQRAAAQADEACRTPQAVRRAGVWGSLGLGALMVLVGWTASRERETADPRVISFSV